MYSNLIFYPIFIAQIWLISIYYPSIISSRVKHVLQNYPADEYPKLYTHTPDYFVKRLAIFQFVNGVNSVLGLAILLAVAYWDSQTEGKISEAIPMAYYIIQMLPIALLELFTFKELKLMREQNDASKRSATLTPRKLTDYVSVSLLASAFICYLIFVVFVMFVYNFDFAIDGKLVMNLVSMTVMNLFFAGIIYWNLYGRKSDPHQAAEDRYKQVKAAITGLVIVSIVSSLFLVAMLAIQNYDLRLLLPSFSSLFVQLGVILTIGRAIKAMDLKSTNFDVYRK
ncbi:hypothetical protein NH399_00945 [Pleionea sp. CnH1-48]|nr:hypothetical protein [Pleionea sp. CnH1-48]